MRLPPLSRAPLPCRVAALLVLSAAVALPAEAQTAEAPRLWFGAGVVGARPAEPIAREFGDGLGLGIRSLRPLGRGRVLNLSIEGGVVMQGVRDDSVAPEVNEERRVRTTNRLAYVTVGPQLQLTTGPVRPYVHAFAGVHYLYVNSALVSRQGPVTERVFETREDLTWALGGGAGVQVPLRSTLRLEAGAAYALGGPATWRIQESNNGFPILDDVKESTDALRVHLGLNVALPN